MDKTENRKKRWQRPVVKALTIKKDTFSGSKGKPERLGGTRA